MRQLSIALALLAVVCLGGSAQGQGGHVDLNNLDEVTFSDSSQTYWRAGEPLTLEIRFTLATDRLGAFTSGFEFGSETGGTFASIFAYEALDQYSLDHWFGLGHGVDHFSADGVGYDTAGFSGSDFMGEGFWPDSLVYIYGIIETGSLEDGQEYCLDSCSFPPTYAWYWYPPGGPPAWGGPYCYEAKTCCTLRGDITFDGEGPNVEDLVYLAAFMFTDGPAPQCLANADIDGSGSGPNISDLIYLATYMFSEGPPPVPCP
jgi:hypothetical protein